ncbi:hypothetical protein BSKO_12406 [Bryopsis sp. KO-2023]|nr:hypothetical protein BSKO_12406 [Bryopsis sp. KO-2023]
MSLLCKSSTLLVARNLSGWRPSGTIRSTPRRGAHSKRVEGSFSPFSKESNVRIECELLVATALKRLVTDEAYVKGGEYLRSLGMTNQAEIARVLDIAMDSNSKMGRFRGSRSGHNKYAKRLTVESDMKPLVAYLKSYDLSNEEVVRLITMYPPILCYSIEEQIEPLLTYLKGVGLKEPIKILVQRPSLLGLKVTPFLEKVVEYVKEHDFSEEAMANVLEYT